MICINLLNEKQSDLIKECWDMYEAKKGLSYVVNPSMPILYFGNSKKYFESPIRIITVGLNPSDKEFPPVDFLQRFKKMKQTDYHHLDQQYMDALDHYFEESPYSAWFDASFEHLLNGLDCSYYSGKENIALHTDICTPIATNPTWSGLNPGEKAELQVEGINIWHKLVEYLQPDIILISVAKSHLEKIKFETVNDWETIYTVQGNNPYSIKSKKVRLSSNKLTNIIFGKAFYKPFGYISNKNKKEVGEFIKMTMQKVNTSPTFVQFLHPGVEARPNDNQICTWNEGLHKRKFLKNRGQYLTSVEQEPMKDELLFWGEWEADARVVEQNIPVDTDFPQYTYEPYFDKPSNYDGKQNTDPFVFGDHFYYSCCRQHTINGPTRLTRLQFGSLVLFGSCKNNEFVLDTLFVIDEGVTHNHKNIKKLTNELPPEFTDVTIKPLYPEIFSPDIAAAQIAAGSEDSCASVSDTLDLTLYKSVSYNYRDKAGGMFSFFPCLPANEQNKKGFKRPVIKLDNIISDRLAMSFKTTDCTHKEIKELWLKIVDQVLEQRLYLGVQTDMPAEAKNYPIDISAQISDQEEEMEEALETSDLSINAFAQIGDYESIVERLEEYILNELEYDTHIMLNTRDGIAYHQFPNRKAGTFAKIVLNKSPFLILHFGKRSEGGFEGLIKQFEVDNTFNHHNSRGDWHLKKHPNETFIYLESLVRNDDEENWKKVKEWIKEAYELRYLNS